MVVNNQELKPESSMYKQIYSFINKVYSVLSNNKINFAVKNSLNEQANSIMNQEINKNSLNEKSENF